MAESLQSVFNQSTWQFLPLNGFSCISVLQAKYKVKRVDGQLNSSLLVFDDLSHSPGRYQKSDTIFNLIEQAT